MSTPEVAVNPSAHGRGFEGRPPFPVIGMLIVTAGIVIFVSGVCGWTLLRSDLTSQQITVSDEGRFYPGQPVDGPFSAYAQAEVVQKGLLSSTVDHPFPTVDGEDDHYGAALRDTVLRSYLLMSVQGFAVSALTVLGGAAMVSAGVIASARGNRGSADRREF